ncbi:MAG: hypothetical protein WA230_07300 [Xanthobacteraceae bacterium]
MTTKKVSVAIVLLLGTTITTLAQSAYTTGTAASSAAAGLASTYGYSGHGGELYAYVPEYDYAHAVGRRWR